MILMPRKKSEKNMMKYDKLYINYDKVTNINPIKYHYDTNKIPL